MYCIHESLFPSVIDPVDLDRSPIALTMPETLKPEYSEGGPLIAY